MEKVFIRPLPGKRVRTETGVLIPNEGAEVVRSTYINRRIKAGDCEIVEQSSEAPASKKKN